MIGTGADFRMTCRAQVAPTEIWAITLTRQVSIAILALQIVTRC